MYNNLVSVGHPFLYFRVILDISLPFIPLPFCIAFCFCFLLSFCFLPIIPFVVGPDFAQRSKSGDDRFSVGHDSLPIRYLPAYDITT